MPTAMAVVVASGLRMVVDSGSSKPSTAALFPPGMRWPEGNRLKGKVKNEGWKIVFYFLAG
jgi:hypothetical protein